MNIKINFKDPEKNGDFAKISIIASINNKEITTRDITIGYKDLYLVVGETKNISFDFFIISSIIYGVDTLISRKKYSFDGWSREFEVKLPVNNIEIWNSIKYRLENIIKFLTGDIWSFTFEKRIFNNFISPTRSMEDEIINSDNVEMISLFSGGLDSLIGIIDYLSSNKNNIILASHYDGNVAGVKNDQKKVLEELKLYFPNRIIKIQSKIGLVKLVNNDNNLESSFRSRSLIFLAIGNLIANSIKSINKLIIPENGSIALNYPLSLSRRSSCSTRTAHPYFLKELNSILNEIGVNISFINPYILKTKGEMIEECKNLKVLIKSLNKSCSCAKRRMKEIGKNHCGICMPCFYRRAALYKNKLEYDDYRIDIFNSPEFSTYKKMKSYDDLIAYLCFINKRLTKKNIIMNLISNGYLLNENLIEYGDVIYRTREEIKNWIIGNQTSKFNEIVKKI
jgi:7-cyano-7-deazaguanine synthase in queuosine biosynthesis